MKSAYLLPILITQRANDIHVGPINNAHIFGTGKTEWAAWNDMEERHPEIDFSQAPKKYFEVDVR